MIMHYVVPPQPILDELLARLESVPDGDWQKDLGTSSLRPTLRPTPNHLPTTPQPLPPPHNPKTNPKTNPKPPANHPPTPRQP